MSKKYRLKKSALVIFLLLIIAIILIILFILSFFDNKSYSLEYSLDEYNISENYDDKEKLYYYEITYQKIKYNFINKISYIKDKKLIKDINKYEDEDYLCLTISSPYLETKPLCSLNQNLISYNLIPSDFQQEINIFYSDSEEKNIKYDNYDIFNNSNKILIWSYRGFNYLNNDNVEFIKLFENDVYDIPLATKINNYLVIPDYAQEYNFNKLFIINLDNLEVDTWNIEYDISYDSYILGINDQSIYLVDRKNGLEYELVPYKKRMRILASGDKKGVIYSKGNEESINLNKLISSNQSFTYAQNYNYIIDNNQLYLYYNDPTLKIKVSDNQIKKIIHIHNDEVYYLVDDTLYKYSFKYGEQKILSYSELSFNYQNLIFIND